jgi:FixJ family two-component response regulator
VCCNGRPQKWMWPVLSSAFIAPCAGARRLVGAVSYRSGAHNMGFWLANKAFSCDNIAGSREECVDGIDDQIGSRPRLVLTASESERFMNKHPEAQSIVFVVDDDASIRAALKRLLQSVGLKVEVFGSPADFLKYKRSDAAACLVLDVRMPGASGIDFQAELVKADIHIPIIFITGHGDIPMTVRAMKGGAVEFLSKPFREQDLLDAVGEALNLDRARHAQEMTVKEVRAQFETLTPREREVVTAVTAGMMNKQIAAELGVSEVTVKVHRGSAMKKMSARSLADLVRMADALGLRRAKQYSK